MGLHRDELEMISMPIWKLYDRRSASETYHFDYIAKSLSFYAITNTGRNQLINSYIKSQLHWFCKWTRRNRTSADYKQASDWDKASCLKVIEIESPCQNAKLELVVLELQWLYHVARIHTKQEELILRAAYLRKYLGIDGILPTQAILFRNKYLMEKVFVWLLGGTISFRFVIWSIYSANDCCESQCFRVYEVWLSVGPCGGL
jgi:hypothetical protein